MIGPNELEALAKEQPEQCFLKGSGVLKLLGAIRDLEGQVAHAIAASPTVSIDAAKAERRARLFGTTLHNQVLAMQAAMIEARTSGPEAGLQWIENTLFGPGLFPDVEAAIAMGGAQAYFDAETAKEEARFAALPATPEPAQWTSAARDVLAERERQKTAEGWTPEHDDDHDSGQLAGAAACYAMHTNARGWVFPDRPEDYEEEPTPRDWPWHDAWWKPHSPRRDLVRAGALILAEIERLDRAQIAQAKGATDHG